MQSVATPSFRMPTALCVCDDGVRKEKGGGAHMLLDTATRPFPLASKSWSPFFSRPIVEKGRGKYSSLPLLMLCSSVITVFICQTVRDDFLDENPEIGQSSVG